MSKTEKVQTGIPGLDEMLYGGLPKGRVILLVGGPGTGKTIFATQFLMHGIKELGENGIFVSLDESENHYITEMNSFGWDMEILEKEKKWCFIDASPIKEESKSETGKITVGNKDFTMSNLIEEIQKKAKKINAQRIIVDPITSLVFHYPESIKRRAAVLKLIEALTKTNATSMLTTELKTSGLERSIVLEEYLSHGVFILQTLHIGKESTRAFRIEKMRGTPIDPKIRPYRITENGIEIYPQEGVFYGVGEA